MSSIDMRVLITQTPEDPVVKFASAGSVDPMVRLMAAVVRQAVMDVRLGHRDAAEWMRSDDCAAYLEILGVDRRRLHDFLEEHFQTEVLQ